MNHTFLSLTAAVFLFTWGSFLSAEETEDNSFVYPKLVTVSVKESVTIVPDVAYIVTGVSSQAPLAEDALKENRETVQKVLTALKDAGISKDEVRMSGSNIATASRNFLRTEGRVGFNVVTRIVVKVKNNEKGISSLLDRILKAGANVFFRGRR